MNWECLSNSKIYHMDFVKLTGVQRQFFDENGYLVVPDVLSPEMIDKLTQVSDRLIESFDADGAYVQRRPGIVQEPDFHPLMTQSPTVPLVAQLLSPNIQLHTTAIIYKFPEPADEEIANQRGWHRDSGLAVDLCHKNVPRVSIKVGYCLTDLYALRIGFPSDKYPVAYSKRRSGPCRNDRTPPQCRRCFPF
ncbi:phytanoyl-CoA dioxygenase family protein [Candidatus Poribacteria bacterium]|nr:phytanoyl-CoA dioxygenase family protein [Candidatus Poribacteria bacterium]